MSLLGIIFTRHSRPFRTRVTNLRENKVVQFSQKPKSFWVYSFILFLHFMIITILTQFCARLEDYLIIMWRSCKYCMCMHFQKKLAQNAQWAVIVHEKVHLKETARHNLPQKSKQCALCNCFKCNSTKVFIVLFFHFSPILHRQNGKRKCRFAISLAKLGYKILLHMSC